MSAKKDLFASSSDSDAEEEDLAQQMAIAAAREKRRDPHAFTPFNHRQKSSHAAMRHASVESDSSTEARVGHGVQTTTTATSTEQTRTEAKPGIRINAKYAAKYEEVKRQKELRRLTEKYGDRLVPKTNPSDDVSEEEEDEEDDEAVLLTEEKEVAFAKAFLAIRAATSAKTEDNTNGDKRKDIPQLSLFFPSAEEQLRYNNAIFEKAMEAKREARRRKFTLADEYRRGVTTEASHPHTGGGEDGMSEEDGKEDGRHDPTHGSRRIQPQSEKERQLRESFLQNVANSTETFAVNPVIGASRGTAARKGGGESVAKQILAEAFALREDAHSKTGKEKAKTKRRHEGNTKGEKEEDPTTTSDHKEDENDAGNDEDANEAFIRDFFVKELWKPGNSRKLKAEKKKKTQAGEGDAPEDDNGDEEEEDEDEDEDEEGNNYAMLAQLAQEEEDERFYADAESWEREYQNRLYRHEEEAADHVQTFPRPIGEHAEGLLRRSANTSTRREARLRRMQRMEEMRQQQLEELKRLKTLKRQEIESQRALIASIAGIGRSSADNGNKKGTRKVLTEEEEEEEELRRLKAVWSEKDLEDDFDPKEFDKKMAELFNEEYYDENNVNEDEIAFFDAELDNPELNSEDDGDGNHNNNKSKDNDDDDEYNNTVENKDGDDVPELYNANSLEEAIQMTSTKSSKREEKSSVTPSAVDPMLSDDPMALLYPSAALRAAEEADFASTSRTRVEKMLRQHRGDDESQHNDSTLQRLEAELKERESEYWQLHHESTLDGGAMKTRFKYREVPVEDFTLSVEEILSRDDRQLNMIAPMSCYAAYLNNSANRRDRAKVERRRLRGFRELGTTRSSRRYGDVTKTALVDPNMDEAAGHAWAERVRDGLRQLGDENDARMETHSGKEKMGTRKTHRDEVEAEGAKKKHRHEEETGKGTEKRWPMSHGKGGRGRGAGYTSTYHNRNTHHTQSEQRQQQPRHAVRGGRGRGGRGR